MGIDALVIRGYRSRVLVCGRSGQVARYDLAVPEDVIGDEQPAWSQLRNERFEQCVVERLCAVLKNEIKGTSAALSRNGP